MNVLISQNSVKEDKGLGVPRYTEDCQCNGILTKIEDLEGFEINRWENLSIDCRLDSLKAKKSRRCTLLSNEKYQMKYQKGRGFLLCHHLQLLLERLNGLKLGEMVSNLNVQHQKLCSPMVVVRWTAIALLKFGLFLN